MTHKYRIIGCIPARYASTRFEGKPLAPIAGKPMIQRVWEQARMSAADEVIIAIGERPDLSYVPREWLTDRGMMDVDACNQVVKADAV